MAKNLMTGRDFVESGSDLCPACGSKNVDMAAPKAHQNGAHVLADCLDCGSKWKIMMITAGYTDFTDGGSRRAKNEIHG